MSWNLFTLIFPWFKLIRALAKRLKHSWIRYRFRRDILTKIPTPQCVWQRRAKNCRLNEHPLSINLFTKDGCVHPATRTAQFLYIFLFRGVHLDYAESDAAVCMTPTSWIILKFWHHGVSPHRVTGNHENNQPSPWWDTVTSPCQRGSKMILF